MANERPSKKRKTWSSCNAIELAAALHALQNFRNTIKTYEVAEPDDGQLGANDDSSPEIDVGKDVLAELDSFTQWMDSKMRTSLKSYAFSSANSDIVSDLQIRAGPPLRIKTDAADRTKVAALAGADSFMNSGNMHKFLDMLLHLVAKPSEACIRTWVDAFLYRASTMLPSNKKMVFNVERNLSPVTVPTATGSEVLLVGFLDYTVVVADHAIAEHFLDHPSIRDLAEHIESVLGFFVVEAKERGLTLDDHRPQVITQLYAAAKELKKTHIRGVLTNGYEWQFVLLAAESDGKGASCRITNTFSVNFACQLDKKVVNREDSDMIAGILASWIEHSCEDIGVNDWFVGTKSQGSAQTMGLLPPEFDLQLPPLYSPEDTFAHAKLAAKPQATLGTADSATTGKKRKCAI